MRHRAGESAQQTDRCGAGCSAPRGRGLASQPCWAAVIGFSTPGQHAHEGGRTSKCPARRRGRTLTHWSTRAQQETVAARSPVWPTMSGLAKLMRTWSYLPAQGRHAGVLMGFEAQRRSIEGLAAPVSASQATTTHHGSASWPAPQPRFLLQPAAAPAGMHPAAQAAHLTAAPPCRPRRFRGPSCRGPR